MFNFYFIFNDEDDSQLLDENLIYRNDEEFYTSWLS